MNQIKRFMDRKLSWLIVNKNSSNFGNQRSRCHVTIHLHWTASLFFYSLSIIIVFYTFPSENAVFVIISTTYSYSSWLHKVSSQIVHFRTEQIDRYETRNTYNCLVTKPTQPITKLHLSLSTLLTDKETIQTKTTLLTVDIWFSVRRTHLNFLADPTSRLVRKDFKHIPCHHVLIGFNMSVGWIKFFKWFPANEWEKIYSFSCSSDLLT